MLIEFDEDKRLKTLEERGLVVLDASQILDGIHLVQTDDRFDYPEPRFLTYGYLSNRLTMFAWTPIPGGMRIISMRKCNEREQRKFARWVE